MAARWLKGFGALALLAAAGAGAAVFFGVVPVPRDDGDAPVASAPAPAAPAPRELANMDVTTVEPQDLSQTIRVSGELRPVNRTTITARASGAVTEVNARPGQAVERGEVLVRFETEDLEARLAQQNANVQAAEAQLVLAQQTLEKTEELANRGFSTISALERAQSDVAAARANVEGLQAQAETARTALGDAELLAPFDGTVAGRSVEPGQTINANTEVMTLVDTSVLEAEVLVPTRDVPLVSVGQAAMLRVEGIDGPPIRGTVDRINPIANEGTRSVPVFVRLDNSDGRLVGGMFATGTILVRASEGALAIPETAIRTDDGGAYVLKLANGALVRQPVELGAAWNGGRLVTVAAGLEPGDTVLSAPLPELSADTEVVVSSAD